MRRIGRAKHNVLKPFTDALEAVLRKENYLIFEKLINTNMETVTIEILNQKVYKLLEDLADLDVIRLHKSVNFTRNTSLGERKFGFAKDMIRRIDDDFNNPLNEFSDYMP